MSKKDLYALNYSTKFTLEGIEEQAIDIVLDEATSVGGSLVGNVVDADNNPVEGATVKIYDGAGRPYRHTLTDSNGDYSINNLPKGNYSSTAVKDGYALTQNQIFVLSEQEVRTVDFVLTRQEKLATIAGVIFNKDNATVLSDALISLRDAVSGDQIAVTTSAKDGEFLFYDLQQGNYNLIATKDGFMSNSPVQVAISEDDAIVNTYITLSTDPETNTGTINGVIKHNGVIVPNCFVGLYDIIKTDEGLEVERLVSICKTNRFGAYMFGNVRGGNYKVKAKLNAENA